MPDPIQTLENFYALMNANGAAHVYRQALACGIFEALRSQPHSTASLCATCGLSPRPAALLLEVLSALGLVQRDNAGILWSLTPLTQMLFGRGAGAYRTLGDPYWQHLPEFLKTGAPLTEMDNPAQSAAHYQAQAEALSWMSAPAAQAAAHILKPLLSDPHPRILDVGAGSAIWSLTLAQSCPTAAITAVDWPPVLSVAERIAHRMGLRNRLTLLPGNYHTLSFAEPSDQPLPFDLAILANVTHLESREGNCALFAKIRQVLKPDGWLAIVDVMPAPASAASHDNPLTRTLYALGLGLRTRSAAVFPPADLEMLLTKAGFHATVRHALNVTPHALALLTAQG